jgi:hypothetical protein
MFWNATTGTLIGKFMQTLEFPAAADPKLARAITFESGAAVPICEVDDIDNSIFPAAALSAVSAQLRNVCLP